MWVTPLVAIALAAVGWFLMTRLAKSREAYDLYRVVQSILEQLNTEGRDVWKDNQEPLDLYTEGRLVLRTTDIERRLELIKKYYNPTATKITGKRIAHLRKLLTNTPDKVRPGELRPGELRSIVIHEFTTDMVNDLLEEAYAHINQGRWFRETATRHIRPPP